MKVYCDNCEKEVNVSKRDFMELIEPFDESFKVCTCPECGGTIIISKTNKKRCA